MLSDCTDTPLRTTTRRNYAWDDAEHWSLAVTVEPTAEPVTVQEAREHCNIVINDDNLWLFNAIRAARILAETYTKRCFVSTTLRLNLDDFPPWEMYIPRPNLVSITTIKYLDTSGVQQTLSSSNYTVDANSKPGRVTPSYAAGSWPSGLRHTNAVEVIYVAGYGAPSAVPRSVKQAILMAVEHWYDPARGASSEIKLNEVPLGFYSLLSTECWGFLP